MNYPSLNVPKFECLQLQELQTELGYAIYEQVRRERNRLMAMGKERSRARITAVEKKLLAFIKDKSLAAKLLSGQSAYAQKRCEMANRTVRNAPTLFDQRKLREELYRQRTKIPQRPQTSLGGLLPNVLKRTITCMKLTNPNLAYCRLDSSKSYRRNTKKAPSIFFGWL